MQIAVIGGGITGLAAAYRLTQILPDASVTIFDKRNRLGGVLETLHRGGFEIEQSADNFITTIPWGVNLCKELGLGEQLVQTNPKVRRTYVVRKGRLHLLPDGFLMMAPTKLYPMAVTPILSWFGKIRAGLELFIPPRKDDVDESMANFVRRRLGTEVFERLVEPLVSGVYAADMEQLSVLATLPRFRDMERKYGSLIIAMQQQLKANKQAHLEEQSGARYSMFVTLRGGLSVLTETLGEKITSYNNYAVRLDTDVLPLQKNDGKWTIEVRHHTNTADEKPMTFDAVIVASAANDAALLLQQSAPVIAEQLAAIRHEGTAIATFAFETQQIKQEFCGMGFVVPKIENNPILAGSFSSLKYEHRAPAGKTLIRVFAGGARAPELAELEDAQLVPLLLQELKRIVKIDGEALFSCASHWAGTMPQYHVGHRERVREIEALVQADKTLALAGNAFHGVGVPNCIESGFNAAEKIVSNIEADNE
ncbi:MAG: protoporphyrinogen oxidase [Planctomycetaceae bacterium]|jgi:oxygen-dependent protoporphyrinogen oxidase|nr:protoporphyrinogen oxidase [Planctomycetaceae bacterium]